MQQNPKTTERRSPNGLAAMKRYTNMEIGAAVAGLLFVIFGCVMIFDPTEMTMIPAGPGRVRGVTGSDRPVHISKTGSQVYGGLSVVMGVGMSWLALYRGRK